MSGRRERRQSPPRRAARRRARGSASAHSRSRARLRRRSRSPGNPCWLSWLARSWLVLRCFAHTSAAEVDDLVAGGEKIAAERPKLRLLVEVAPGEHAGVP